MIKKIFSCNIFFLFTIIIILFIEIYSLRWAYLTPYDKNYLRDLYDHSQWTLALSKRSVSDEQLYQVASEDLINNLRFFTINPEAPVLAKYFYGLSIIFFNNPNFCSLLFFIFSIFLFYLICRSIIINKDLIKIALLIFITEPLIFHQASVTMLDLPQLFFFLLHLLSIIKILDTYKTQKTKKILLYLILAGVSLGGFISIKIGFFGLIILIIDLIIFYKIKKIFYLLPLIFLSPIVYLISYFPYFLQGNSFVDFLKAQKWILNYWLFSASAPNYLYGLSITTMLFGITKGWFQGATWEKVDEWTIFWPIYLIILSYFVFRLFFKKEKLNLKTQYFIYLLTSFSCFYIVIPFFTRYLLLSLPLFIILFVTYLPRINKKFLILLFVIFFVQFIIYLNPSPKKTLKGIIKNWEISAYQDLYSYLDNQSKKRFSRYHFWRQMQLIEKDLCLKSKKINIKTPFVFPWQNKVITEFKVVYQTCIGNINHNNKLYLQKENNSWKIKWKDDLIFNNFSLSNDQISSKFEMGTYGKLILPNGEILNEEIDWPFFFVLPKKIKDENKLQQQLFLLTGLKKYDLELLYKANNQIDIPVPIGFLKNDFSLEKFKKIKLEAGIIFEYQKEYGKHRFYNPKFINKIQKIKELEYKYLKEMKPSLGGVIKIIKKNGQEIILLKKDKIDGKDIIIDNL